MRKKQNHFYFCLMLIFALLVSGRGAFPEKVRAAPAEKLETRYHLDIGAQHIWGKGSSPETAAWENGHRKGSTMGVRTTLSFPEEVFHVRAYPLNPANFDFGAQGYSFNKTCYLQDGDGYESNYLPYASQSITNIRAEGKGKEISLSYSARLESKREFNLKEKLNEGELPYILDMLGGEALVKSRYPLVYARLSEGASTGIGAGVFGFLYFTPVVIEYQVKVPAETETLRAELSLPGEAGWGETYTAEDVSAIPPGVTVARATLEKHYGNREWQTVAVFEGSGEPGKNTGGRCREREPEEGEIAYRLTVTGTEGQTGSDIKTIRITDNRELKGEAELKLPRTSYEGHPVIAEDRSRFTVDGKAYSAYRMYLERLGENRFLPSDPRASNRRLSRTESEIRFPVRGEYEVELAVSLKNGIQMSDRKPVTILKTPSIISSLSGTQKQNRRQNLNITVATHPDAPLTELWAEISKSDGTEKVYLFRTPKREGETGFDDGQNKLNNSETIKTRPIRGRKSDAFFTRCQLPFLTKNQQKELFSYTIFAKDSRGNTDRVSETFSVRPDEPPRAEIRIPEQFLREKGKNKALITAEDASGSDGDQLERRWQGMTRDGGNRLREKGWKDLPEMEGFKDLSFGSRKKVEFVKEGVGEVALRLQVTDVWTEETLPEYVTESDRRRAETTVKTKVANVAPVVRGEPVKTRKAEILMIAGSEAEYRKLESVQNSLAEKLIERGVDGRFRIGKLFPEASPDGERGFEVWSDIRIPFGQNGGFLESKWFSAAGNTLYTVNGTWPSALKTDAPEEPYTITAYRACAGTDGNGYPQAAGKVKWSCVIPGGAGPGWEPVGGFAHDDKDRYLFFRRGKETLVFDAACGTLLTKLPFIVGERNYLQEPWLYSFEADGIYGLNMETGKRKKIYGAALCGETRKEGGAVIFAAGGGNRLYRGRFDPDSEEVTLLPLSEAGKDPAGTAYVCHGTDVEGRMIIGLNEIRRNGTKYPEVLRNARVRIYDGGGALLREFSGWDAQRMVSVLPVADEGGKYTHLAVAWERHPAAGSDYTNTIDLWDLQTGEKISVSNRRNTGFFFLTERPLYAGRAGDKVYVQMGGYWGTVSGGEEDLRSYYTELANLSVFDLKTKKGAFCSNEASLAFGAAGEYAKGTEALHVPGISYDRSREDPMGGANGLRTKVVSRKRSLDEILSACLLAEGGMAGEKDADLRSLVLYDKTNRGERNLARTGSVIDRLSVDGVFISGNDGEENGYKRQLADRMTKMGLRADSARWSEHAAGDVADFIAKEEGAPENVLRMEAAAPVLKASAERSFFLEPGKLYCYEYDFRGKTEKGVQPLSFHPQIRKKTPVKEGPEGRYRVLRIEKEDFNDGEINPFFSLPGERIGEGVFRGADLSRKPSAPENRVRGDGSVIRFAVPEGEKAILSFDYCHRGNSGGPVNTEVRINGKPWRKMHLQPEIKGSYIEREFLPEGENTVEIRCVEYGSLPVETWAFLDNITVAFLEEAGGPGAGVFYKRGKDGQLHTFTAPRKGIYRILLKGPASDSAGGTAEGKISLEKGQRLEIHLGPAARPATGARNGADGADGGGHGDNRPEKARIILNGKPLMTAGGGGGDGNPGSGDRKFHRYRRWEEGGRMYEEYLHGGTGGAGGKGGEGGGREKTPGRPGEPGSKASSWQAGNTRYTYLSGGPGGRGGAGGASYTDPDRCIQSEIRPGSSWGEASVRISWEEPAKNRIKPDQTGFQEESLEGGWRRFSGTLQTPPEITGYGPLEAELLEIAPGQPASLVKKTAGAGEAEKTLRISVPKGKTARDAAVEIVSRSGKEGNTVWTWNEKKWIDFGDKSGTAVAAGLPSGKNALFLETLAGDHLLTVSGRGGGSSGDFLTFSAVLTEKGQEAYLPEEGSCFFDREKGLVYGEKEVFEGSVKAKITVSGPENFLRNLKIYTVEKGNRILAAEGAADRTGRATQWDSENLRISESRIRAPQKEKQEEGKMVYKKGELVRHKIFYSDYENDPSRKSFWKYTHTPLNDGPHPLAAVILNEDGVPEKGNTEKPVLPRPVERFFIDGKYTAEHWQEDNTARKKEPAGPDGAPEGFPLYDKKSNREKFTFYIEGGATAPWIKSIETMIPKGGGWVPGSVSEGTPFRIRVRADDLEKDELRLITEVYREKKQIFAHRQEELRADKGGNYPEVITDTAGTGECGAYRVVCTVRDKTGAGLGTHLFNVTAAGNIAGKVMHTKEWDRHRREYNLLRPVKGDPETPRGSRVFWSGERFMLEAAAAGAPEGVSCRIKEAPEYRTEMKKTGTRNHKGEILYDGSLWEASMEGRWGREKPELLTFVFTARYKGGKEKRHEVTVIIDDRERYRNLQRRF